jgi:hypothetical protein
MINGKRVSGANLSSYIPGSTIANTAVKTGVSWFKNNDSMTNIGGNGTAESKMSQSYGKGFYGGATLRSGASPIITSNFK